MYTRNQKKSQVRTCWQHVQTQCKKRAQWSRGIGNGSIMTESLIVTSSIIFSVPLDSVLYLFIFISWLQKKTRHPYSLLSATVFEIKPLHQHYIEQTFTKFVIFFNFENIFLNANYRFSPLYFLGHQYLPPVRWSINSMSKSCKFHIYGKPVQSGDPISIFQGWYLFFHYNCELTC